MIERMHNNLQSNAINLTKLNDSAAITMDADFLKILTVLTQVININLTHENSSLVFPFFFSAKTLGTSKSKPLTGRPS